MIDNSEPLVSVIMSVFSTPRDILHQSVLSILNQTYKNFEFIIICDGDIDAYDFLNSLSDSRIRLYLNQKNMGLAYSLNRAIRLCSGDYLFRMDADDISYPERFEIQFSYLRRGKFIVSALCHEIDYNGSIIGKTKKVPFYNFFSRTLLYRTNRFNPAIHPSIAAHKKVFQEFEYDNNLIYGQDYELWKRMSSKYKIYFISKYLLAYRVTESNPEKKKYQDYVSIEIKKRKKSRK